jgi:hypothetical protein
VFEGVESRWRKLRFHDSMSHFCGEMGLRYGSMASVLEVYEVSGGGDWWVVRSRALMEMGFRGGEARAQHNNRHSSIKYNSSIISSTS